MSNIPAETKVFRVDIRGGFYVLALSHEDALAYLQRTYPLDFLSDSLPARAEPYYEVSNVMNQSQYMRDLTVNGDGDDE
jgi:hypothetical protein